jgi:hypothetical protein
MEEQRDAAEDPTEVGAQGRRGPACPHCGGETRFAEGVSTHDLFAERFVCSSCGRETYRSFGRGSVS